MLISPSFLESLVYAHLLAQTRNYVMGAFDLRHLAYVLGGAVNTQEYSSESINNINDMLCSSLHVLYNVSAIDTV